MKLVVTSAIAMVLASSMVFAKDVTDKHDTGIPMVTETVKCDTAKSCILECKKHNDKKWTFYGEANDGMEVRHFSNGTTGFFLKRHAASNSTHYLSPKELNCRILNQA